MKYLSVFSGIEAASAAWEPLGWGPVAFCEFDEFPSAVLARRWPEVPNLGDITKVDWSGYHGNVDVVVGGSPCFPEDVLVTTDRGCKSIKDVRVGDMVLTHRGRFRKVLKTGGKVANTVLMKGQGHFSLEATPNHPFLSVEKTRVWNNEDRSYDTHMTDEAWTEAGEMNGKFWQNLCTAEQVEIPKISAAERGQRGCGYIENLEMGEAFFYFVGRWLGDGWLNVHSRKGRVDSKMKRVFVCCPKHQREELFEKLDRTGLKFCVSEERTATRFCLPSTQVYDWLKENFGSGASGKFIPGWCLGMDEDLRSAMLRGYLDADGTVYNNGHKASTVSKALAIGLKQLAGSLGFYVSMVRHVPPETKMIEGRIVNQKPQYVLSFARKTRSAVSNDKGYYGLVRSVEDGRENQRVYNLEVDEDNSYCADGIAVHNCQSFSVAGNRTGLDGASGLMWEYVRCVREVRPRYFVWENVPGALSSAKGDDFRCLLEAMDDLGYGLAWRVLDAQFFGVAQRRRRVFLVGSLGDKRAADVLFEPDCLRWDHPSSRVKRQSLAARAAGGAGERREKRLTAAFSAGQSAKAGSLAYQVEIAPTLRAGESGTNQVPTIMTPKTMVVRCGCDGGGKGALIQDDVSMTLSTSNNQTLFVPVTQYGDVAGTRTARHDSSPCADRGVNVVAVPVCLGDDNAKTSCDIDMCGALKVGGSAPIVSYPNDFLPFDTTSITSPANGSNPRFGDPCHTLAAGAHAPSIVERGVVYKVRRLTPTECERLQGFPDGHTDLTGADPDELFERMVREDMDEVERKKLLRNLRKWCKATPDGKRYKACGNSMAVPVMRWIGERIEATR